MYAQDVASGELPLTVAFARETVVEDLKSGTPYSTYTTYSGVNNNSGDDGAIKDED